MTTDLRESVLNALTYSWQVHGTLQPLCFCTFVKDCDYCIKPFTPNLIDGGTNELVLESTVGQKRAEYLTWW